MAIIFDAMGFNCCFFTHLHNEFKFHFFKK